MNNTVSFQEMVHMTRSKSVLSVLLAGLLALTFALPTFAQEVAVFDTVSGSISYRLRIALAPAEIVVELVDVTMPDAPKVIASQRIITNGRQVPLNYQLAYETASINPDSSYVVRASIYYEDGLAWVSDADARVITNGVQTADLNMIQFQGEQEAASHTVTGTVSYLQRIALPDNAVVLVELLDISLADAPSVTLASQQIITNGRQVPLPFTLSYDAGSIAENATISVSARVLVDGELQWISDTVTPVITNGVTQVDILLVQVGN
jgi:putative lipoprotein